MSASIYWRPIRRDDTHVPFGLRSRFVAEMVMEFGPYPWRLSYTTGTLIRLQRVHDAMENDETEGFNALVEALISYREIEVWPEY